MGIIAIRMYYGSVPSFLSDLALGCRRREVWHVVTGMLRIILRCFQSMVSVQALDPAKAGREKNSLLIGLTGCCYASYLCGYRSYKDTPELNVLGCCY